MPYAESVADEVARREAILSHAGRRRPVDPASVPARDVLACVVQKGAVTIKRIGIEADVPSPRAVEACVAALERAGHARLDVVGSRRGAKRMIVVPTEAGRRSLEWDAA